MRNWYLTINEHGRHIQRADINEDNYICNVESNDSDAYLINASPELLNLAKKFLWVIEDRISIIKEEYNASYSMWDEYAIEDFEERLEHYELLKQEVEKTINKAESK